MFNLSKCNKNLKFAVFYRWNHYRNINSNLKTLLETMPKQRKHVPDAQKQRKLIKEKFSKYVPGRITLQVLGTGAVGAPRSLYVFTDQSRYLFNCGEGTQRLAHEHKMKLAKLEHIFITQSSWNNIGGLPGTALTIQDVGVPQITLHGPKGLDEIFNATRRFVILRDLCIEVAECSDKDCFEDNVMKVKYVPIQKNHKINIEPMEEDSPNSINVPSRRKGSSSCDSELNEDEDSIDYYAHERKIPFFTHKKKWRSQSESRRTYFKNHLEQARISYLKNIKAEAIVMCYVCKLHPRPGALSLDKCVKYGVPTGPLLGKLKMGEDITLPSGVVIHSADVCEPDDPGPVFLVVDCPSEEYLQSFVSRPEFKIHQETAESDDLFAYLVVHFTPAHIMRRPEYKKWMDQFRPSTQHLILNDSNTCMGSESVHRIQYKLNLLHDNFFPVLGDAGSKYETDVSFYDVGYNIAPAKAGALLYSLPILNKKCKTSEDSSSTSRSDCISESPSVSDELPKINTFCNFHLRPKKGFDRSNELLIKPAEYIDETMQEAGFAGILYYLREGVKDKLRNMKIRPFPSFLFLGTGSCIPNKTRNTSGILYQLNENVNILMDCGEGTYGQLIRFFGSDKAQQVVSNIKAIFISHLHADHHIGLIGLLQGRRQALIQTKKSSQKLLLLAPKQIMTWLKFYDEYFENIAQEFELISNDELLFDDQTIFEGTKVRMNYTLGMIDIGTTHVRHCPNAFGISFKSREGHKICYSGDTMPSENLINLGNRCDLLIHEATMEDELENEAILKMHSTTSQAIEVGRNMNARHILLTHFSQRYAKLPKFNNNFTDNVGIAFDNMQIRLDELPLLPLLYPALRLMFAEHYEELETKSLKRQLKLQRDESEGSLSSNTSIKKSENGECSTTVTLPENDCNRINSSHDQIKEVSRTPSLTKIQDDHNNQNISELVQAVSSNEPPTREKNDKPKILGKSKFELNKDLVNQQVSLKKTFTATVANVPALPELSKIFSQITKEIREDNSVKASENLKKAIVISKLKPPAQVNKSPYKPASPQRNAKKRPALVKPDYYKRPKSRPVGLELKVRRSRSFPAVHNLDNKDVTIRAITAGGSKCEDKKVEKCASPTSKRCFRQTPIERSRSESPQKQKVSKIPHYVPKVNITFRPIWYL